MTPSEREQVIALGRPAPRPYERDASIHALFSLQAARTPDALAVFGDDATLTYRELDLRSNQVAAALIARGVRPGACVGIALERCLDVPVGLLGILKAGGVYVPLDPSYPPERLRFMVDDASLALVLGDAATREHVADCGVPFVAIDEARHPIVPHAAPFAAIERDARAPAYIMYTSGSTGRAKGVIVPHRAVVRLVRNSNFLAYAPDDVVLHYAPIAFDASTLELWGPLLNGARLAVPKARPLSIDELGATVAGFGVTTMWLTVSLFERVAQARPPGFAALRCLLTGGDVVSPAHARSFLAAYPACRLVNGYGPTENTTFSTTYDIRASEIGASVPIGRPIANSSAYVLDDALQPLPLGEEGELCVGGDGVALGYLRQDALTAERFIPDPFADDASARLYRTGDRARLRPDGVFEFLGRTDDQVKIRGFRIELGEIEASLRACAHVRAAAVVVAQHEGDKTLVACVVPAPGSGIDAQALRSWLVEKLPAALIPHRFVLLDRLPEHASGKLDRVALARSVEAPALVAAASRPPANGRPVSSGAAMQATIGNVWRDVLRLDVVPDPDENFFDAGGDSLLLLSVHSRLKDELRVPISVIDLFEHVTIRRLAAFVGRASTH